MEIYSIVREINAAYHRPERLVHFYPRRQMTASISPYGDTAAHNAPNDSENSEFSSLMQEMEPVPPEI